MMTLLGKCQKEKKNFLCSSLFKRDLLLSATFEEFLDKKLFSSQNNFEEKKEARVNIIGVPLVILKFGKSQNNCFLRGELTVG